MDGIIDGVIGVCASLGRHVEVTVDDAAFLLEKSLELGVIDVTKLAILDRVPIIVLEFHSSHVLAFFPRLGVSSLFRVLGVLVSLAVVLSSVRSTGTIRTQSQAA